MPTFAESLANAYSTPPPADRRSATLAASWKPNPDLEALAASVATNPAALAELSTNLRMQLGYYLEARNAAQAATAAAVTGPAQ